MKLRALSPLILLPFLLLSGCDDDDVVAPQAVPLTIDAVGYYCNMTVSDHPGPKGQIHRAGGQAPLWFSSVRDAVAYTMQPDEAKDIVAIYVQDMSGGRDWSAPGDDAWIEARGAWFVIGSSKRGGMGLAEVVPFAQRQEAAAFADEYGGTVVDWQSIPQDYVLDFSAPEQGGHGAGSATQAGAEGQTDKQQGD